MATHSRVPYPCGNQQNRSMEERKKDWNSGNIVTQIGFTEKNSRGDEDTLVSLVCVFLYIFLKPQKFHREIYWNTADNSYF